MEHTEPQPSPNTDQILVAHDGELARIVLNRPRAINALTEEMVTEISALLEQWRDDEIVSVVTIEGAGERGLCAGGDVVAVSRAGADGGDHTGFFRAEYAMNEALAAYPKPIVAFMDGVVMGGGVGVSAFTRLRLVTERTKLAMPETIIGFFPDVGALYLLSRAPGELGAFLALTGTTIGAADVIAVGLADRLIDSAEWPAVRDAAATGASLDGFGTVPAQAPLLARREWIDACFAGDDPAAILARLESSDVPAAVEAAAAIRARSPLSVAITLEALRRAADLPDVVAVLAQDLRIAGNLGVDADFTEGVRAQLIDKDRSPRWKHDRVEDVTRAEVEAVFA